MCGRLFLPFLTHALHHHLLLLLLLLLPPYGTHLNSLFHVAALHATTNTIQGNATDLSALLAFKALVTHDPFGDLSSWNSSLHYCHWQGVTCGGRRHPSRVTALNLSFLNLTGSLSPNIANLTFLRSLNLSNNLLHGTIPPELCHGLRRLQFLDLSFNSFQGEILDELPHCSRLKELILHVNMLEGVIPANLSTCTDLQTIDLDGNKFMGSIPSALGSLRKLTALGLGFNNFTGLIPPALGNLSSLIKLDVQQNSLWGHLPTTIGSVRGLDFFGVAVNMLWGEIPSSFFNLSSIYYFNAGHNQLSGTLPKDLGLTLPKLQFFGLYADNFEGPIPMSIANASNLIYLYLSGNRFSGPIPANMGRLRQLYSLLLDENRLEARVPRDWDFLTSLANCSGLTELGLFGNQLSGMLPKSLANLSTQLTSLDLGGNYISGSIPAEIGRFTNLTVLYMLQNLFAGAIPTSIGNLQILHTLGMGENNLSGELPSSLGNLTLLNKLGISQNRLQGRIPRSVRNLQNLEYLDLSSNELNGTIPNELGSLSAHLLYLNLSHNLLAGPLPPEVGNFINLEFLDVSENKLSGDIPSSLGQCEVLESLYMQGNRFQGNIPPSLSNVKGIQKFDLSRNNLSGSIPDSFKNLQGLRQLNLSFNNLEGRVPETGPFANASKISVNGNDRLCGGIPELHLQPCPVDALHRKQESSKNVKLIIFTATIPPSILLILFCVVLWKKSRSRKQSSQPSSSVEGHMKISYAELFRATDGFSPANLIGTGSFGSVYKGTVDFDPQVVAVKVLDLQVGEASRSFENECNTLKGIRHRNLVKIITACSSIDHKGNDFKALVLEFMPNGSLEEWLHSNGGSRNLSLSQRLNIAIDVALVLDYLHHHHGQVPIIHCDLKPSNVLLDHDMTAHVSDFGLARFLPENLSASSQHSTTSIKIKGTIGYVAPEYGIGCKASTEGDVYSYGVLLLEMFIGKRPTNEMFKDGINLHNFVSATYLGGVMGIIDPLLFSQEEEDTMNINLQETIKYNEKINKCLTSIMEIGLGCSKESPKERMEMGNVVSELRAIQKSFEA